MMTEISYEKKEEKQKNIHEQFHTINISVYKYGVVAFSRGIKSSLTSFPYYLSALYRLR